MATLYAWAVPAWFSESWLDHTWVTDFDNQTNQYPDATKVAKAGFNYWFCWGAYHEKGGIPANATGALGKQSGSRTLAKCLVRPNVETKPNPPLRARSLLMASMVSAINWPIKCFMQRGQAQHDL